MNELSLQNIEWCRRSRCSRSGSINWTAQDQAKPGLDGEAMTISDNEVLHVGCTIAKTPGRAICATPSIVNCKCGRRSVSNAMVVSD
jgi:hypothetical protein